MRSVILLVFLTILTGQSFADGIISQWLDGAFKSAFSRSDQQQLSQSENESNEPKLDRLKVSVLASVPAAISRDDEFLFATGVATNMNVGIRWKQTDNFFLGGIGILYQGIPTSTETSSEVDVDSAIDVGGHIGIQGGNVGATIGYYVNVAGDVDNAVVLLIGLSI